MSSEMNEEEYVVPDGIGCGGEGARSRWDSNELVCPLANCRNKSSQGKHSLGWKRLWKDFQTVSFPNAVALAVCFAILALSPFSRVPLFGVPIDCRCILLPFYFSSRPCQPIGCHIYCAALWGILDRIWKEPCLWFLSVFFWVHRWVWGTVPSFAASFSSVFTSMINSPFFAHLLWTAGWVYSFRYGRQIISVIRFGRTAFCFENSEKWRKGLHFFSEFAIIKTRHKAK